MGILDRQPAHNIKRGLMLMSKILQNIANHVEFSKEQHMLHFNDLLRSHFEAGRRFFIQVCWISFFNRTRLQFQSRTRFALFSMSHWSNRNNDVITDPWAIGWSIGD